MNKQVVELMVVGEMLEVYTVGNEKVVHKTVNVVKKSSIVEHLVMTIVDKEYDFTEIDGEDPIASLNKAMAFLTTPKSPRNSAWFKEKILLVQAQKAGEVLDEEQLAFLADPRVAKSQDSHTTIIHNAAFQTDDLDAFDSDCTMCQGRHDVIYVVDSDETLTLAEESR
nr:hypothetical protein [Tanacetum cinerariifolium]